MYDIVYNRLAQSSDVIFVLGMFILFLVGVLIYIYKRSEKKEETNKTIIKDLHIAHSKDIEDLNASILKALIDNTAALVSIDKNYTELRDDIKDIKNGN